MKNYLRHFDWALLAVTLILTIIGVLFIQSAGAARNGATLQGAWRIHAVAAAAGFGMIFALAAIDYRRILAWGAWPLYALALVALVAVLFIGSKQFGGRRWLWFFQPSEVSKLAVIILLAHVLGTHATTGFKTLLKVAALAGIPAALILAEPDLGTALVLVPTVIAMLFAARVWIKGLLTLLLVGAIGAGLVLGAVYTAETQTDPAQRAAIYQKIPLKPHQISRLKVFLFPESDPNDGGWNLRQAKISIGSGSLTGKGLGKGDQKINGYLPPSVSMNDFIFAVLAEEWGFAGSALVLSLFLALLILGLKIAFFHPDDRGRLLAIGITALVFLHVYVNVAMSIGLVPITGLPLPFISAGKTFLITLMLALGLLESVAIHKGEMTC